MAVQRNALGDEDLAGMRAEQRGDTLTLRAAPRPR